MDYQKVFGVEPEPRNKDDWTEEDDAAIADIIKEIEDQGYPDEFPNEDGKDSDRDTGGDD